MDINKKIALIAAGSLVSTGALFAVINSANAADTTTAPAITSPVAGAEAQDATDVDNLQEGNQNEADEAGETESASDGPDQGPDTDASEAGHQDAPGADDATEGAEVAGK